MGPKKKDKKGKKVEEVVVEESGANVMRQLLGKLFVIAVVQTLFRV
jgi:hypothetical protein